MVGGRRAAILCNSMCRGRSRELAHFVQWPPDRWLLMLLDSFSLDFGCISYSIPLENFRMKLTRSEEFTYSYAEYSNLSPDPRAVNETPRRWNSSDSGANFSASPFHLSELRESASFLLSFSFFPFLSLFFSVFQDFFFFFLFSPQLSIGFGLSLRFSRFWAIYNVRLYLQGRKIHLWIRLGMEKFPSLPLIHSRKTICLSGKSYGGAKCHRSWGN